MGQPKRSSFPEPQVWCIMVLVEIMTRKLLMMAAAFLALPVLAAEETDLPSEVGIFLDLSGAWSTSFTLDLRLPFTGWELQAQSTFRGVVAIQSFVVGGHFGALDFETGLTLRPVSGLSLSSFTVQSFEVVGGFASFRLTLGNVTFRFTLIADLGDR